MTSNFDQYVEQFLTENSKAARIAYLKNQAENLSPEVRKHALEWISDCEWDNLDPEDIPELSNAEIVSGINRSYSGGWEGFLHDSNFF